MHTFEIISAFLVAWMLVEGSLRLLLHGVRLLVGRY